MHVFSNIVLQIVCRVKDGLFGVMSDFDTCQEDFDNYFASVASSALCMQTDWIEQDEKSYTAE